VPQLSPKHRQTRSEIPEDKAIGSVKSLTFLNSTFRIEILRDKDHRKRTQKPVDALELAAYLLMLSIISKRVGKFFRLIRLYFPFLRGKNKRRMSICPRQWTTAGRNP